METEQLTAPSSVKGKYKRVDMGFVSMRLPSGLPRFAILRYDDYLVGRCSWINVQRREGDPSGSTQINDMTRHHYWAPQPMRDFDRQTGREVLRYPPGTFTAEPSSQVPQVVQENIRTWQKEGFENLSVAWEATWREAQPAPEPLDPILIGQRDGKHWILATWDLTKLESYVVAEFTD